MSRTPNGPVDLDETDLRLLDLLREDPRVTMSELARRAGISGPTATTRVQRLERRGVIRGYRVDIDPGALGSPLAAYVRMRPSPGQLARVAELARDTEAIVECHRITGEECYLMRVQVADVVELEKVIDLLVAHGQTTTSVVQSSPVPG